MLYIFFLRIDDGWLLGWYEIYFCEGEEGSCRLEGSIEGLWILRGVEVLEFKSVCIVCFYVWVKINERK